MTQLKTFFAKYKFIFISILLITFYLILKNIFWPMQKNISVLIQQQNGRIFDLNTLANINKEKQLIFDQIKFREGNELFHDNTGYLRFKNDFFMHVSTQIIVLKEANYLFRIKSDDGFRLKINNQLVCEQTQGQVFATTNCTYPLKLGEYLLELDYFQGYGNLGLEMTYEAEGAAEYYIGKNSNNMAFKLPNLIKQ
jgi:hypothetical protein